MAADHITSHKILIVLVKKKIKIHFQGFNCVWQRMRSAAARTRLYPVTADLISWNLLVSLIRLVFLPIISQLIFQQALRHQHWRVCACVCEMDHHHSKVSGTETDEASAVSSKQWSACMRACRSRGRPDFSSGSGLMEQRLSCVSLRSRYQNLLNKTEENVFYPVSRSHQAADHQSNSNVTCFYSSLTGHRGSALNQRRYLHINETQFEPFHIFTGTSCSGFGFEKSH